MAGNREALGVVVHTLIDNAVKYAPPYSEIRVEFGQAESGRRVELTVQSLGPKIEASERQIIFLPFARGKAAKDKKDIEGMGFGLAFAHQIMAQYGLTISLDQSPAMSSKQGHFETRFSVLFERSSGGGVSSP